MHTLVTEFRQSLASGRLVIQTCRACGRPNMYPRSRCPFCHSDDLGWTDVVGTGTLHSFTVIRVIPPAGFGDQLPYAVGVVKLDEGVQLLARLQAVDDTWDAYSCDVRVAFDAESTSTGPAPEVPWFALAEVEA
jgi:uncharacterized protein